MKSGATPTVGDGGSVCRGGGRRHRPLGHPRRRCGNTPPSASSPPGSASTPPLGGGSVPPQWQRRSSTRRRNTSPPPPPRATRPTRPAVRPAPSTQTRCRCCYAITEAAENPFYASLAVRLAGGSHPAGRALPEVLWDDWARRDRAASVQAEAAGRGGRGSKTRGNDWSTRWLQWVAGAAGVGETGGGVGGRHGVAGGRGVEDREGGAPPTAA